MEGRRDGGCVHWYYITTWLPFPISPIHPSILPRSLLPPTLPPAWLPALTEGQEVRQEVVASLASAEGTRPFCLDLEEQQRRQLHLPPKPDNNQFRASSLLVDTPSALKKGKKKVDLGKLPPVFPGFFITCRGQRSSIFRLLGSDPGTTESAVTGRFSEAPTNRSVDQS